MVHSAAHEGTVRVQQTVKAVCDAVDVMLIVNNETEGQRDVEE